MFTVTYAELTHPMLQPAFQQLTKMPLDIKASWNIARLAKKVAQAQQNYQTEVRLILKEYVNCVGDVPQFKKDDKGEAIQGQWDFKDQESFDKAYIGLMESKVDIESFKVKASELSEKIPAEILIPLEGFLEDDLN